MTVRELVTSGSRSAATSGAAANGVARDAADLGDLAVRIATREKTAHPVRISGASHHEHMFGDATDGSGGPRNRTWRSGFGDRDVTDTPVPLVGEKHCRCWPSGPIRRVAQAMFEAYGEVHASAGSCHTERAGRRR